MSEILQAERFERLIALLEEALPLVEVSPRGRVLAGRIRRVLAQEAARRAR